MLDKLKKRIKEHRLWRILIVITKKIKLPGFEGLPLYDVARFFVIGLQEGAVQTRASALSYSFFLAIFPAVIFVFTLIPYIPIEGFQDELLALLKNLMPQGAYEATRTTIEDIIKKQRTGLLSFGFIMALYFATTGVDSMFDAFNATYHSLETRPPLIQKLYAIVVTVIFSALVFTAIMLLIFGETAIYFLFELGYFKEVGTYYLLLGTKWLTIIALIFFTISFLYYLGPAQRTRWRFFSAGSTLATALSLITSVGFSFFINNFNQYNKIYGSIGTLLIILVWIKINAVILLIGFELNVSIQNARRGITDEKHDITPDMVN